MKRIVKPVLDYLYHKLIKRDNWTWKQVYDACNIPKQLSELMRKDMPIVMTVKDLDKRVARKRRKK